MIQLSKIAEERGIEEEDVIEFLTDFLEYSESEDLPGIREAIQSGDAAKLRQRSHSLKGAALNLGLTSLAAVAQKLETGGVSCKLEEASTLLEQLEMEMDQVREVLPT
jgi:HPt (histidine-containing phosphotransfer) domain-containing protein